MPLGHFIFPYFLPALLFDIGLECLAGHEGHRRSETQSCCHKAFLFSVVKHRLSTLFGLPSQIYHNGHLSLLFNQEWCTYSYRKSLDVFIFTVLDDLIQSMVVMGFSISDNDHDFLNSPSGTPGLSESLLPEVITKKRQKMGWQSIIPRSGKVRSQTRTLTTLCGWCFLLKPIPIPCSSR